MREHVVARAGAISRDMPNAHRTMRGASARYGTRADVAPCVIVGPSRTGSNGGTGGRVVTGSARIATDRRRR
jgi:hypothetical protein